MKATVCATGDSLVGVHSRSIERASARRGWALINACGTAAAVGDLMDPRPGDPALLRWEATASLKEGAACRPRIQPHGAERPNTWTAGEAAPIAR